jgi:hypothetical protein
MNIFADCPLEGVDNQQESESLCQNCAKGWQFRRHARQIRQGVGVGGANAGMIALTH